MDDLTEKINSILNDPQAMQQVSALAGMLGNQNPPPAAAPSPPPQNDGLGNLNLGALAGLLGGQASQNLTPSPAPAVNGDMMQTIMKIMPLLSSFQQEDEHTRLLHSLRPLLSPDRQKRLDEATKLMKIFRLLPMLQSRGIL